jgi:tetratricopeptide (TPR) repeat protein
MRIKYLIIVLFMLLGFYGSPFGQETPIESLSKGNSLYESGNFSKAIEVYESILQNRYASAELFYNLGNAYFRNRQIGYAVLNYEKAKLLDPHNTDIEFNLNYLRETIKEPQPGFFESVIGWITNAITLNLLTILCSIFYFVFVAGFLTNLFIRRKQLSIFNIAALCLFLSMAAWLFIKIHYQINTKWAVVVSGPCEIRNGPEQTSSVAFSLPEGRKVVILSEKDDWFAVGLPVEGLKGWLEKKYVKNIWPVDG